MNKKLKFYSLDAILEKNAQYNIIIGERSNGKTTAVLRYCLNQYIKTGGTTAYIRRYDDDIKASRGSAVWDTVLKLKWVEELTKGYYTRIIYKGRSWYLANEDPESEGKYIMQEKPFAHAFALTQQERYKGLSFPDIQNIMFDEFLTRSFYLNDEFIIFMNLLSTIIRERDGIKIFMLGNTVNKYSPYFSEMGLNHIKDMKKGSIDLYSYGNSQLRVAVEFADFPSKEKPSDIYFAFDNPRLNMITGQGQVWEIAVYPHAPCKWRPKDILFSYFIMFDGDMLQADIIETDTGTFTYIHRKTTPLQDPDKDILFSPEYDIRPNHRRSLLQPPDKIGKKIEWYYIHDRVYYQDNETGEIIRNFLQWCKS